MTPNPEVSVDRDELAEVLLTASRALVAIAVRSIYSAPVDITIPQHRLLVLLDNGGDQTVGALAEQLGVDPSNGTRICDRLERLHLVTRRRSESDRRTVHVSLTEAGKEVLRTIHSSRREDVKSILAEVPASRVRSMVNALRQFNEAADEASTAASAVL